MSYYNLIAGSSFFLLILIVHIVVWNIIKPKSEIISLIAIFLIFPTPIAVLFLFCYRQIPILDFVSGAILYLALAGVYLQTYPAFTCVIPSFNILKIIKKAGGQGITISEIKKEFSLNELIGSRIELLESDNLIRRQDDKLKLTLSGNALARFFILYRKILGLPLGES